MSKSTRREVRGYLHCGDLRHGFVQVQCDACGDDLLVGFSCEGRGRCPSCNPKKATLTAKHLVDAVLPAAGWRLWTLSLPFALRWLAVKDTRLFEFVLRTLVLRIFALLRRIFKLDVLACPCGGRRAVPAVITSPAVAREILGLPQRAQPFSACRPTGPPQFSLL